MANRKRVTKKFDEKETKDFKDRKSCTDKFKSTTNDWKWYASNPQLVQDVASLPYGVAVGTQLHLDSDYTEVSKQAIPGICALHYIPTCGYSDSTISPVNVAARNLYTYIRHVNSGAKNYDSPDLIMYLLAMDSAYSYLAYLKRIYGVAQLANIMNRYYPKAVLEAMRVDSESVFSNLANFRTYINTYATKLASMTIPNHLSYMAKHQWMNSGLYTDGKVGKSQLYFFNPEGFHVFSHDGDFAGALEFVPLTRDVSGNLIRNDVQALMRYGDKLLNPILYGYGEEDFNVISGDILKAYGESGVYRAEGISAEYVVVPVYDETVLSQIQNATMFGYGVAWDYTWTNMPKEISHPAWCYNITQSTDKSYVISKPHRYFINVENVGTDFYKGVELLGQDRLINSRLESPDANFTLEATRFTVIPSIESQNISVTIGEQTGHAGKLYTCSYVNCGSEILTAGFIYTYQFDNYGAVTLGNTGEVQSYMTIGFTSSNGSVKANQISALAEALNKMNLISQFDWHPFIQYSLSVGMTNENAGYVHYLSASELTDTDLAAPNSVVIKPKSYLGDVDNYTVVTQHNLSDMNQVALLSMFGLENYGR